ncbi:MAG: TlpA family protein disulfide reductase [Acidobacteriota bacterium]|nr:TlpA family protein disulfide reductase [Acidobacteriota bacterium]
MTKGKPIQIALIAVIALFSGWHFSRSPWGGEGPVTAANRRHEFPQFVLTDLSGETWKVSGQRGKVVLVNVWASWCPPFRQETPGFVHLSRSLDPRAFAIAGITMDENKAAVVSFVHHYQIPYRILLPDRSCAEIENRLEGLPTSFLLDPQGRIAKTYLGAVRETQLRSDVEQLLTEGKQKTT